MPICARWRDTYEDTLIFCLALATRLRRSQMKAAMLADRAPVKSGVLKLGRVRVRRWRRSWRSSAGGHCLATRQLGDELLSRRVPDTASARALVLLLILLQSAASQAATGPNPPDWFKRTLNASGNASLHEGRLFQEPARLPSGPSNLRALAALVAEAETDAESESGESLRRLGVTYLLLGRVERALQVLRRQHAVAGNAQSANDLAVGLMLVSRQNFDSILLFEALDLLDQIDPSIRPIESKFNRAICLSRLGVVDAAGAWQAVEEGQVSWLPRSARWSGAPPAPDPFPSFEALAVLSSEEVKGIVAKDVQSARVALLEKILPEWGRRVEAEHDSSGVLSTAQHIADGLATLQPTSLLVEGVGDLLGLQSKERVRTAKSLARFGEALDSLRAFDVPRAAAGFEQARDELAALDNPISYWVSLYESVSENLAHEFESSGRRLDLLSDSLPHREDDALEARLLWLRGYAVAARGRPEAALNLFQKSRERWQSAREPAHAATLTLLAATALDDLGMSRQAWKTRLKLIASGGLWALSDAQRDIAYMTFAEAALGSFHDRAGLYFMNTALAYTRRHGSSLAMAENLGRRALIRSRLGDSGARADLQEAEKAAGRIAPGTVRDQILATLMLARAELYIGSDPERGLEVLSQAIREHEKAGYQYFLVDSYRLKARALQLLGRVPASLAAVSVGIAMANERLSEMSVEASDAFLSKVDGLFREGVRTAVAGGLPDEALRLSEERRLRISMLTRGRPASVVTASQVGKWLQSDESLVVLTPGTDHVYRWVITTSGEKFSQLQESYADLSKRIARLHASLATGSQPEFSYAARLGQDLFRDIFGQSLPPSTKRLLLVLDGSLSDLPVVALRPLGSSSWLIEKVEIVRLPSLASVVGGQSNHERAFKVAVVADPDASSDGRPAGRLPNAARTAEEVVRKYPEGRLFVGADATPGAVIASLGWADVLHLASHMASVRSGSGSGRIYLAMGDNGRSVVEPSFLREAVRGGSATRLVVLAGCSSGIGRGGGDGVGDLVETFLGLGVEAVISTLWAVDDHEASEFAEHLHQQLADGVATSRAFQLTVKHQLEQGGSPLAWVLDESWGKQ